jgi:hypothetical protein
MPFSKLQNGLMLARPDELAPFSFQCMQNSSTFREVKDEAGIKSRHA